MELPQSLKEGSLSCRELPFSIPRTRPPSEFHEYQVITNYEDQIKILQEVMGAATISNSSSQSQSAQPESQ